MKGIPSALFDSLDHLNKNHEHVQLPHPGFYDDFYYSLNFLKSYTGSLGTFNSYRREVERLLQWAWLIKKKSITLLKRDEIEQYLRFCQSPPDAWIAIKKSPRFTEDNGQRQANPLWRPFVVTVTKAAHRNGKIPDISQFELSQGAIQEIFAILSTYYNFLIAEEYAVSNPIALIRQKSKFVRKSQQKAPVRRLSILQWETVLESAEAMAHENPKMHERTRFILSLLYGMYLRISELVANERHMPAMNDFYKDSQGRWWFRTIGKGNKERQIAVSDAMLKSLSRWRLHMGLSALPSPADNAPLIPKIRGTGPMTDTAPIRRLIQTCFNAAEHRLHLAGHQDEAEHIACATVHWLRHTGISEDVKTRPREHVRDDAGHSSSATTDRYIDVELAARHQSAKQKVIEPI